MDTRRLNPYSNSGQVTDYTTAAFQAFQEELNTATIAKPANVWRSCGVRYTSKISYHNEAYEAQLQ